MPYTSTNISWKSHEHFLLTEKKCHLHRPNRLMATSKRKGVWAEMCASKNWGSVLRREAGLWEEASSSCCSVAVLILNKGAAFHIVLKLSPPISHVTLNLT